MQYFIVEAHSAKELQEKVQYYIDKGWEPQGGVSVAVYDALSWWYYQAMILREQP